VKILTDKVSEFFFFLPPTYHFSGGGYGRVIHANNQKLFEKGLATSTIFHNIYFFVFEQTTIEPITHSNMTPQQREPNKMPKETEPINDKEEVETRTVEFVGVERVSSPDNDDDLTLSNHDDETAISDLLGSNYIGQGKDKKLQTIVVSRFRTFLCALFLSLTILLVPVIGCLEPSGKVMG
jgi:hypothetical protein